MPSKSSIEIAGYYHLINRDEEQKVVFKEAEEHGQKKGGSSLYSLLLTTGSEKNLLSHKQS